MVLGVFAACAVRQRAAHPSPAGALSRGPAERSSARQTCAAWCSSAAAAVTESHRPRGRSLSTVASESWRLKPEVRCPRRPVAPGTRSRPAPRRPPPPCRVLTWRGCGEREHTLWCLFSLGRRSHHAGLTLVASSRPSSLQRPGL